MENNNLINKTNEMARELQIIGTQTVNGQAIKIIEGGFGEGQKCMLASDIAKQHEVELRSINVLINNNITRFTDCDLLDLKSILQKDSLLEYGYTRQQVANFKNIYLLSERGYTKLVAMMDNTNEKKWEVMDMLIDGYFQMREALKHQTIEQLPSYEISDPLERAERWIEEFREKEAFRQTMHVQQEQLKEYKPKAEYYDEMMDKHALWKVGAIAQDFGLTANKLNVLLAASKIQYRKGNQWLLYAKYRECGYAVSRAGYVHSDGRVEYTTYWTELGRAFITGKLAEIGFEPVMTKNNQMVMEV